MEFENKNEVNYENTIFIASHKRSFNYLVKNNNLLMQPFKSLFKLLIGLFLIPSFTFAQAPLKNYEKEWKIVEELINKKNLPKSALAEVKKIYRLAKNEKQDAQVIKATVYMLGLQQELREENEISGIKDIEKEIASNKEPVAAILNSLLAEVYWNYFQSYRWRLYERSETRQFKKEDISTWSAGDFHNKISALYLQSIKNEKLLQQTRLNQYDAIIIKGTVRHLRPTLYDLLTHRALEYFKNDERDIAKPSYAFEIDQPSVFEPAADFIKINFSTKDTTSLQYKALLAFQKLIAFHLHDVKPDALLDVDIQRLEFGKEKSTHPDKEELYRNALSRLINKYNDLPAASQAWYLLAREYDADANSYNPFGDTTQRYSRVKAKEICEKVISHKDSSEGKINCLNLLKQINSKNLNFNLEKVNVPGQAFRTFINYKNIEEISLRLIKPTESLKEKLGNNYDEKLWAEIIAAKPVRSWQQNLPVTNDLQQHSVEIKVDALPVGEYILLASTDNFSKNSILGARLFYVSNISYVARDKNYFVLHRETGKPLAAADIQTWDYVYDSKNYKYTSVKGNKYKTDANGYFSIQEEDKKEINNRRENYKLEINWNNDRLFIDDWVYNYYYRDPQSTKDYSKNQRKIFFFTDRSIYRPGQTVYFKGITIMPDKEKKQIPLQNFSTTVYLKDANYQLVDSITLLTNEFGSFSGKFQLPASGLNGLFNLQEKEGKGSVQFSVEEYKRPKFYVEYENIKKTFKVNDTIKLTGFAKAYAGNNIDGATVKYRVVREPRFIYPWIFWRWWQPPVSSMEIAHGEVKTNKDGKFFIAFEAIPDKAIDKKLEPVFDYKIYADITDINGETRSGETIVSVSYKSLLLKVNLPATLTADSLKNISIRTENMSGEYIPATLKVVISKLKSEKRLIRKRYWERPDQFVMSKEEYISNFPFDEYSNETDYRNWEKEIQVFEKSDSTKENSTFNIQHSTFQGGWHVIEITAKDKNGEEVKDIRYIQLTDDKSNQLTQSQYLWTQFDKRSIEPGEKTSIKLGSSAKDLFIIHQVDKTQNSRLSEGVLPDTSHDYKFISLNNEKKSFDFPATEADRGGYGVGWFFIKDNRFYQYNDIINVPWSNKDLQIEYATFRDKTLPGSEEKWKLKITGYKKEKLAAEMLASMYDASLDQFKMHSWIRPSIWPIYYSRIQWNGNLNFSRVESMLRWNRKNDEYISLLKSYDHLIQIQNQGFSLYRNRRFDKKVTLNEVAMAAPSEENKAFEKPISDQLMGNVAGMGLSEKEKAEEIIKTEPSGQVQIRKNFNETAFFFPDLRTDSTGAIEFSFTLPEALTKWKFQAISHTKDLALGYSSKEIVTQKELMVQPNPPRFLREGDKMEFSAKIVNLSEKELTGTAELQLFDATTNESVDGWFMNMFPNQYFTVAAGQSDVMKFPIEVPFNFGKALSWRIVVKSGAFSDGEEAILPVLTNRMLVTESIPLNIRGTVPKNFYFEKLTRNKSETLQHHSLTVEYTSNPVWYAVQALPYLMEYPYECAEQIWNSYYANALASKIANSSPRILQIFESWSKGTPSEKTKDTAALLSNLQKNQELKAVLLEETPWVLQAKNEEQQKRNIALLFDLVRMSKELNSSFEKLKQMQSPNGGFVWFKGGPDNAYMTQYIVTGIGHLKKLGVNIDQLKPILNLAIPYLDMQIKKSYDQLIKQKTDLAKHTPGHYEIQYLYMRSFFPDQKIPAASQTAYNYFRSRAQITWVKQSKYMLGMLSLALHRTGDAKTPVAILKSLKETAINHEELGMYWKENSGGYYWYQAPIETQALLIEAFHEVGKDTKAVDDLKTWLLKNKQTNNWKTTKATAEACYAMLLQGTDWLTNEPTVEIKLGDTFISSKENKQEAGTGYFKKVINGPMINSNMGNISVSVTPQLTNQPINQSTTSWGAVYWQYFENLDKITTASTPLKLEKKLFVETNTDRGPVLTPINEGANLKVGDKIKVRIELRTDRDMEYVHMKDMRASCMEPTNVLSGYKWQGGLGYYETTKDASTSFFFDYLRKGTYVFEYSLFVTHTGNFSNGITSIQCMYAPEFSSHSEGIRINVE